MVPLVWVAGFARPLAPRIVCGGRSSRRFVYRCGTFVSSSRRHDFEAAKALPNNEPHVVVDG